MSREDDSRLIGRAKRGQADAYRQLVERYKDRLFAFIWKTLRSHHDTEDICQAAFVKAYESLGSYDSRYAFSTWLFTIAYRLCLNHLRKRKASAPELEWETLASGEEPVEESIANTEEAHRLRHAIWAAVDELTPAQRSAVILFYQEGKSCAEIGEVLGTPAVTVKSHLHRAREKLRALLEQQFAGDISALSTLGDTSSLRMHS